MNRDEVVAAAYRAGMVALHDKPDWSEVIRFVELVVSEASAKATLQARLEGKQ